MLERVIRFSVRHRVLVLLAWIGVAVLGAISFFRLPLDAFPDTTPVQVQVNTVAPALSPLEIERRITIPIEQVVSGLSGLTDVRSVSKFGLSQVTAIFADGTDIDRARQQVFERVQSAPLGPSIPRPTLGPVATGLGEIFHYIVSGDGKTGAELRYVQDWVVARELRSVRGVAEVNSWGGDERRIEVRIDPSALHKHDLTLADVIGALERNNKSVGGGAIDVAGGSMLVQGVGLLESADDVGEVVVEAKQGVPIRVKDLGEVAEGREIRRGAATAGGKGEVVLGLAFLRIGENGREVSEALRLRLADISKNLPQGIEITPVYQRAELVDHVLETVETNLFEGALLVIAVLFLFLGNLRAGLIVASAIPLSMLFAFDLMLRAGVAGSLMSLGAIDFGLIVDSSVISVENAVRHLAANDGERDKVDVITDAAVEVRRPTLFGELVIMAVYLPVLALEGVEGKLFRPMALTVIFALIGSMLLSVTLIPALSAWMLPARVPTRELGLLRSIRRGYRHVLAFSIRWRGAVLAGAALLLANALFVATRLGSEPVPRLMEGSIVINTIRLAGVSLDESVRYGLQIERALLDEFPDEIDRVWTRTGTAEVATDPMGIELSDIFIQLRPRDRWKRAATQAELVEEMEAALSSLPGMRLVFTQPIEMRVNEMIAGVRTDLGVKIFAEDFDVLKKKAREIEAIVRDVPGTADVFTEQLTGQPSVVIEVDRAALARHGVAAEEVLQVVEALGGVDVGEIAEGERKTPLSVVIPAPDVLDPRALGALLVTAPGGVRIPLSELARIDTVESPSTVQREWGRRRLVIQANVRGRDVGSTVAEVRERIAAEVELPPGVSVRYGGQFEQLERAKKRLLVVVPITLALIFVLLTVTYGRLPDALRVFTGVPLALIGGVFALFVRGMPLSISAAVGFIALFGVAVLGDMVLVSTIRQHLDRGVPLVEAVERAAEQRLRPVLMTALVASVGFLPMALSTGIGAEVQRPIATVVIGGVLSSTLLTLVVLPALVTSLGSIRRRKEPGAP